MNILITNIGRRVYFVDFLMVLKKNFKNFNIHLANNDKFSSIINYKKTKINKIPLFRSFCVSKNCECYCYDHF